MAISAHAYINNISQACLLTWCFCKWSLNNLIYVVQIPLILLISLRVSSARVDFIAVYYYKQSRRHCIIWHTGLNKSDDNAGESLSPTNINCVVIISSKRVRFRSTKRDRDEWLSYCTCFPHNYRFYHIPHASTGSSVPHGRGHDWDTCIFTYFHNSTSIPIYYLTF